MRIEHWWYTLPLRLRSIFQRRRVEAELEEELAFHLEHRIAEGIAEGLSPGEARRRALIALGGPEAHREEIRDARRVGWLTDFVADLRFAVRSLRRTPGLTAIVVVTLALGIGIATTPFSMVDALILRPYPVPDPGEVVSLVSTTRDEAYGHFSHLEYQDLRERTRSYRGVVAHTVTRAVAYAASAASSPRIQGAVLVSGNYFSALGVEPRIGRGFLPGEDLVPGRDAVVVLGHGFWERELASDPGIVGGTIRLNGTTFTVVGVAPESFPGMSVFSRPDFFVPLAMARRFSTDPRKDFFEDRGARELRVMARLAPGVSLASAREEAAALAARFRREHPELGRDRGAAVRTAFEMRTRGDDLNWKFGVTFWSLALAVLLVACTNVAGLLLSRARARTREIAVRLALGAGRFRLVRLLLAESLILAALGAAGGVALGYAGIEYLRDFSIPAELPVTIPFRMDGRVLAASLALAVLSALLASLAPALRSARPDLVTGLKSGELEVGERRRLWGRSALVVAQVAASLMLLAASLVMARSFRASVDRGIGFSTERLLIARFDPRVVQYDAARTQRFYELLTERVRAMPGVRAAALSHTPPLNLSGVGAVTFVPEGYDMPADRESFSSPMDIVDEGFFATLGIPIVGGRGFLPTDTAGSPPVAVVNEQLALRYWPGASALGRRLRLDGPEGAAVEIVGIARNVRHGDSELPTEFVYLPLAQQPQERMALILRSIGDPLALARPVRDVVRSLDPNLPVLETRTYEDLYRYHFVEGPGVAVELAGTMGVVALVLTIAGLYGIVAYTVARRTREIGIRMAIGAGPASALRLVIGGGLALVGTGMAIGLVLAVVAERLISSTLFAARGVDLVAYLVVTPAMLLATLLAAYLPARRAARIPPTLALRYD